jgi:hypothetical protein
VTVVPAKDLRHALGLSAADTAEMEYRSELTVIPVERIEEILPEPSIRISPQPHQLNGMSR